MDGSCGGIQAQEFAATIDTLQMKSIAISYDRAIHSYFIVGF